MAEENKKADSVKITLIGGTGVGKTCIIRRFSNNTYEENPPSTLGGSYSLKFVKVGDKQVQLDLWDTAGQEKYRSLGKHFYKDAYIVVFVYDITNRKTFDEIKEIWYPNVKEQGEKYTVLALVGNKSDMFENEEVKEEEAKAYAKEINATFMLVSAKSGDNVKLLFSTLVRQYLGPEFVKKLDEMKKQKGETNKVTINKSKKKKEKKSGGC